jgi:hypothetical protein
MIPPGCAQEIAGCFQQRQKYSLVGKVLAIFLQDFLTKFYELYRIFKAFGVILLHSEMD